MYTFLCIFIVILYCTQTYYTACTSVINLMKNVFLQYKMNTLSKYLLVKTPNIKSHRSLT